MAYYFSDGSPEMEAVYKDNLLDGSFIRYYENGLKQGEGNYTEGRLDGTFTYYDEYGDPSRVTTYKKGLLDGPSTTYFSRHQGGGVCHESQYEKGLLSKSAKMFYDTGELLHEIIYHKGIVHSPPVALKKNGKPISFPANKNKGK
jgi:antitoxin component YwqK of YwqJK toxin-antitoxin module